MKLITDYENNIMYNDHTYYASYITMFGYHRSLCVMSMTGYTYQFTYSVEPTLIGVVKYAYHKSSEHYSETGAVWNRTLMPQDVLYELTDQEAFTLLLINTI